MTPQTSAIPPLALLAPVFAPLAVMGGGVRMPAGPVAELNSVQTIQPVETAEIAPLVAPALPYQAPVFLPKQDRN